MRVTTVAAGAVLGAAAMLTSLAVPAAADAQGGGRHPVRGEAYLTGEQEVPGPGDPNGEGEFRFKAGHGKLCYKLEVRRIGRSSAAHIHFGPEGEAGPVAVTLRNPRNGESRGCIRARNTQNPWNAAEVLTFWELEGIKQDPYFFYVNVHTNRFPDGAVRGQLMRTR